MKPRTGNSAFERGLVVGSRKASPRLRVERRRRQGLQLHAEAVRVTNETSAPGLFHQTGPVELLLLSLSAPQIPRRRW